MRGVGLRVFELLGFTAFRASGLVRKTGASVKGLGFRAFCSCWGDGLFGYRLSTAPRQ